MTAGETEEKSYFFQVSRAGKILFNFILPFIVAGLYFFITYLILPYESFEKLMGLMVINLIPPAGKESIIPLGIAFGIPWWVVASSTMMMDICGAIFMALNFDLALKIPVLGGWIKGVMKGGENFFESHKWLEKLSEVGLVLFVVVPFQGSGGIGGTLVGRMMGLSKLKVLASISLGAFIGSFSIALGVVYFIDIFRFDPVLAAVLLSALMLVIASLYLLRERHRKRLREGLRKKRKFL
ncbi:putative membrane protein [Methanomicrobium sp. W14]|uniref:small multi-drug export protein n=1 Tax=Methanomicrobium sp. W14 TaxID=2817839 RepID=UPI001AE47493|nr:small multi-drug export protein [Methanomicrobium sp. W14]MBP2133517.1 putative membrane protein [Methanomicrobium sp. W14]